MFIKVLVVPQGVETILNTDHICEINSAPTDIGTCNINTVLNLGYRVKGSKSYFEKLLNDNNILIDSINVESNLIN